MDHHRRSRHVRAHLVPLAVAAVMGVAACSPVAPATPSAPTAGASSTARASSPAGASPTAGAASAAAASSNAPEPTHWPTEVQDAVIAVGAMQTDLGKAVNDLSAAVAAEDVGKMRTVARNLAAFMGGNLASAETLRKGNFPELGGPLVEAMTAIRDGATAIGDGIEANDSAAIEAGFERISAGMRTYATVQPKIADLVPEALRQRGALLR
jgi:hypothetical protein